jgi:hypothetical protein
VSKAIDRLVRQVKYGLERMRGAGLLLKMEEVWR